MDAGATPHAKPAVFQDLPFAEAAQRMVHDDRLLVVDATAAWCMPCQTMDRNTWVDAQVVGWLQQHALAIQIDVDAQSEVAKQLNIRSMPTLIAFRRGKEVDRTVGAKTPAALLDWLQAVSRGERSADRLRAEVSRNEEQTGTKDLRGRLELAGALLLAGEHAAATDAFCWLWNHALEHDQAFGGVRISYMTSHMEELAASFPPAREAFAALRDRTAERLSTSAPTDMDRSDWIALNRVLGDGDRTLAWFEQVRADPTSLSKHVAYELEQLLLSHGRWRDVAVLYPDPMASLKEEAAMLTMEVPELPDLADQPDFREIALQGFRAAAGRLYAALLAAGRNEEARGIADEARRLAPSAETTLALVWIACDAGQQRPEHWTWIDAPELRDLPDIAEVRKRLESSQAPSRAAG